VNGFGMLALVLAYAAGMIPSGDLHRDVAAACMLGVAVALVSFRR
jgi:hypothetical protein